MKRRTKESLVKYGATAAIVTATIGYAATYNPDGHNELRACSRTEQDNPGADMKKIDTDIELLLDSYNPKSNTRFSARTQEIVGEDSQWAGNGRAIMNPRESVEYACESPDGSLRLTNDGVELERLAQQVTSQDLVNGSTATGN